MNKQCWICGSNVNLTKEHKTKKSDLKAEFSRTPLYLSTETQKNLKVQGYNSDRLKSETFICAKCNNERTQPHDRGWEKLSAYLRALAKRGSIKSGDNINLGKCFPGAVHAQMLNVHLYFVKSFGGKIKEANIPIDLTQFAEAILNNKYHNNVWLAICPPIIKYKYGAATDVEYIYNELTRKVVSAVWYYELSDFSIRVMYAVPEQNYEGLRNAWHPLTVGKYIKIAK